MQNQAFYRTGLFGNFFFGGGNFAFSKREFPVALYGRLQHHWLYFDYRNFEHIFAGIILQSSDKCKFWFTGKNRWVWIEGGKNLRTWKFEDGQFLPITRLIKLKLSTSLAAWWSPRRRWRPWILVFSTPLILLAHWLVYWEFVSVVADWHIVATFCFMVLELLNTGKWSFDDQLSTLNWRVKTEDLKLRLVMH